MPSKIVSSQPNGGPAYGGKIKVAEAALAHTIDNKTEAAYRRGDLFAKRAKLMQEWANYCAGPKTAGVTPIRRRKKA